MGVVHVFEGPEAIPSPPENVSRTVRVFVPDVPPGTKCGLLVMHDGQNAFDQRGPEGNASWGADTTLSHLFEEGAINPWVVVAVDHRGADRIGDYSPWPDPRLPIDARGPKYGEFIARHLVPWARKRYDLLEGPENTAVTGSSMGGLITLYLAWRYADTFGRAAAFSPSAMWSHRELFRYWSSHPGTMQRIYIDAGSNETLDTGWFVLDYGEVAPDFANHLRAAGYTNEELRLVRDPRGVHTEGDWRRRFPPAMRWLLRPLDACVLPH